MSCIKHDIIDFLRSFKMDFLDVDFDQNVQLFSDQMSRGLSGQSSSLEMIPTFLQADNEVPIDTPVIVADAGGTNFRVATVYFDKNKKPVIEHLQKFTMPGVERQLSRSEFFSAMAEYFSEVASASRKVGFCFSYPVEMLPNKDGRLIRFAKEIKAGEVVGELIGENLATAMDSMGIAAPEKIILLNDTVATLLAGFEYENRSFDSYIGFILGTGTNCCYLESNRNITKQPELNPDQTQIINAETGGMASAHRGQLDAEFDKRTTNPGVHAFEKMISGAYLGPLAFFAIKKASDAGLLSNAVSEAIAQISDLDTRQANEFLYYPYGDNPLAKACRSGGEGDLQAAYTMIDRLVERAAKLSAINLSAVALKTGKGKDPSRPICIVAEGTTFYQMKSLRSRVEFYLKQYLEDQHGVYFEIISVENATLIGAAIAGLTN